MCVYVNVDDAKWIDMKNQQSEGNNKKWKRSGFDKSQVIFTNSYGLNYLRQETSTSATTTSTASTAAATACFKIALAYH